MTRVLIAAPDAGLRDRLRAALTSDPCIEIVGQARDGQEAVQLSHMLAPDVAVLTIGLGVYDGLQVAEYLVHSQVRSEVVLLSDNANDLRRAMRAGARDHLVWPCSTAELVGAVNSIGEQKRRRLTPEFAKAADSQRMCRVITVSGAKGGIGKTTLATNLALALLVETGEPTALIDLYTQFGDVAMLLNISPRRGLVDLARQPMNEFDAFTLEDYMERHDTGLCVLSASLTPVALDAITAPLLDKVMGMLKQRCRYLVLDVPPILHPTTLHALSHATQALLIANLFDVTTIKDTRLLLDAIAGSHVPNENICIVVNRVSRQNRLRIAEIEKVLGRSVTAQIPNDGRIVPHSVNQGEPFVLAQPRSAVAQSVRNLACRLAAEQPARRLAGIPSVGAI